MRNERVGIIRALKTACKNRLLHGAIAGLAFICSLRAAGGATVFVNASQTSPPWDGTSWSTAFPSVQSGIDSAQDGDTVWVAAGTYYENITVSGGISLYGGFNGSEVSLD